MSAKGTREARTGDDEPIVVIGGGVAGLATALALSQDGRRVLVLERDGAPAPPSVEEASGWKRPGTPQHRHSHAFMARLRKVLRERAPALLDDLLAAGVEEIPFDKMVSPLVEGIAAESGDEEIAMLASRRTTFEWALRRHVEARPGVEILAGVECLGLTSEPDARTGLARVTGVRLHGADRRTDALPARLVVDAGGRRTKSDAWLAEAGIKPPQVETRPCGIFYSSRFYEICEGAAAPARSGLFVGDLGYLRFGNFPADHRIFSLTLSGEACDAPLRSVIDPAGFERVVRAIPSLAPWVADGVSRPISPVHSMADLDNARRFVVSDRRPFALGFVPVGDALIHTNPIYGWGCSLAFVNAYLVADALRRHPSDLHAFALDLDEGVYRDIRIYYKGAILQDVDAAEISATLRRGEDPFLYPGPTGRADRRVFVRSLVQHGVKSVMHEDPKILRAALRGLNLLEMPTSLLGKADLLQRVMVAWNRRAERVPLVLGPGRDEMLALLCRERTTERGERSEPAAAAPTARGR